VGKGAGKGAGKGVGKEEVGKKERRNKGSGKKRKEGKNKGRDFTLLSVSVPSPSLAPLFSLTA